MGILVDGALEGLPDVGIAVGRLDKELLVGMLDVGELVGRELGQLVGCVGVMEGTWDGGTVGIFDGILVGMEGAAEGIPLGIDGAADGTLVGNAPSELELAPFSFDIKRDGKPV